MDENRAAQNPNDIYNYAVDSPGQYEAQVPSSKAKKPKVKKNKNVEGGEPSFRPKPYKPKKTGSPVADHGQRHATGQYFPQDHQSEQDLSMRRSSFAPRISPSRLTSQVVSALPPEESFSTSKLHSALTGKLQPHPTLRDTTQSSPVRVPSPARHPSPGSVNRSTPPMQAFYPNPLGIKVSTDYNPGMIRLSPQGRFSPKPQKLPQNLPHLSPNFPTTPPRSEHLRESPGPPRMSGPYVRPEQHVQPFRYTEDLPVPSVKTSTSNFRITSSEPDSLPRHSIPSNLQHLVMAMEREKEQELRESSQYGSTSIPFTSREYPTEHKLTERLLRQQGVEEGRHLERIYMGAVHQGHSPSSSHMRSSSPMKDRTSPVPERTSPAPHPKKDFQRRATPPPPPKMASPPMSTGVPSSYLVHHPPLNVTLSPSSVPPIDLSMLPLKHKARRLEHSSSPATSSSLSTIPQPVGQHTSFSYSESPHHSTSVPRSQLSSMIAQPMVQQIPASSAQHQPPPNVTAPMGIPTMLLQTQLNLPKIEAHGGVIRIPEGKLDASTQEMLSRAINFPPGLSEQISIVADIKKDVVKSEPQHHAPAPVKPPQNINPFTFPKSGIKLSPIPNIPSFGTEIEEAMGTPPTATYPRSRSDISHLRRHEDVKIEGGMPRLMPEDPEKNLTTPEKKYGDYQAIEEESKKLTPWVGQFNMRLKNLANFPVSTSTYRSAYRAQSVAVQRAKACSITGAGKSLDLLRQTLQKSMNKELDEVIQKYVEKFFKVGIANIKENTGPTSVTDEHLNSVRRQILEEAKKMYIVETRRSVSPSRDYPDNISDTGSNSGKRGLIKKRRFSDSDSEKGIDIGVVKKVKKKGRAFASGRSTPSKIKTVDSVRREGPKWDPERLALDTLFVMGARANKALGLGNTRGRLYIKHPDVFKYSGDQDDKQWLYEHHLMPATGGKAYMLIVEDIKDLAETDEYRDGALLMHELNGFAVPEWMISKMKLQMQSLRTDKGRTSAPIVHSRSATPSETSVSSVKDYDGEDSSKTLPFSGFSDSPLTINPKTENENTSMDAEMEFLSGTDIGSGNMSPFNLTGGFDDTASPSPSDIDNLDEDPSYTTPFGLSKS